MHIYLIRHGQSVENTHAWDGRNYNSPLTPLGEAQAAALGAWLPSSPIHFDHLYVSTMQRTRQTAQAILKHQAHLKVHYDDRLREVGNARPDGTILPDEQLPRYYAEVWGSVQPYKAISESGETWMHFRARIGAFLEWLLEIAPEDHADFSVGVVCHGGVIEGCFEHVFQKGPWSAVVVRTHNTGITHLEYKPSEGQPAWLLHYHNQTRHLNFEQLS